MNGGADFSEDERSPLVSSSTLKLRRSFKSNISSFDDILEKIGDWGWWQKIVISLLWLPSVAGGALVLLFSFTGLQPPAYR